MGTPTPDPFDPGPRHRGAGRAALKGRFAAGLKQLVVGAALTAKDIELYSTDDEDHRLDAGFIQEVMNGESWLDADSFVFICDALMKLGVLTVMRYERLKLLYLEESIAHDRYYGKRSGRVSETRPPDGQSAKGTKRTERTGASSRANETGAKMSQRRRAAGEEGFEPSIA